jgi:uncharacterized protein (DUF433 family)
METQTACQTDASPPPKERIVSTPDTCGGSPRVAGTRIRVQDIYFWHEVEGKSPDELVTDFPQLSMADVYAALSYFWAHREPMLREIEEQRLRYEQLKSSQPSLVAEKLKSLQESHAPNNSVSS